MPTTTSEILATAQYVARLFKAFNVEEVLLFGSLARRGDGADIDMILVVDPATANVFLGGPGSRTLHAGYKSTITQRYYDALSALGLDIHDRYYLKQLLAGVKLDIFLLPPDWRENLEHIQAMLADSDPSFMANIAADARRYDPVAQEFEPS